MLPGGGEGLCSLIMVGRGHFHPKNCKACGKHESEVGRISQRGHCIECALRKSAEQIMGMHTFTGEWALRWRRAVAASVGAILPEDE